jgi:excisionase family DNA binding protein
MYKNAPYAILARLHASRYRLPPSEGTMPNDCREPTTDTTPQACEPIAALTVRQVAEMLAVSVSTVERMVKVGQFPPGFVIGGRAKRWSRAAVLAWIDARQEAAMTAQG